MQKSVDSPTDERTVGRTAATGEPAALLAVQDVADMLGCSQRHVYRLADAGRMPAPVKLGALVRWSRKSISQWIDAGCPSCRRR